MTILETKLLNLGEINNAYNNYINMLALDKLFCVRNNKSIGIVCSVLQKTLWLYSRGSH